VDEVLARGGGFRRFCVHCGAKGRARSAAGESGGFGRELGEREELETRN